MHFINFSCPLFCQINWCRAESSNCASMSIKEAFSIVKANALGFEYQKGEEIIVERGHNCHFLMGIITKKVRVQGYLSVHFSELRGLCSMNCSSKMFFIFCNFSFMNVLSSVPYLKYFADTTTWIETILWIKT